MKNAYMAGTYSVCVFHGVLRWQGFPSCHCLHRHVTRQEARACADEAKATVKAREELPPGWVNYKADD
jgi:hypothetical protein